MLRTTQIVLNASLVVLAVIGFFYYRWLMANPPPAGPVSPAGMYAVAGLAMSSTISLVIVVFFERPKPKDQNTSRQASR